MSGQSMKLYLGLNPPKGLEAFHYPIIAIKARPLESNNIKEAFGLMACYTHLIFTSQNAAALFFHFFSAFNCALSDIQGKCIIAVGKKTASALERHGLKVSVTAQEETAEGVVKELAKIDLKKAFLFWGHAAKARAVITDFLKEANARYEECILYDTVLNEEVKAPPLDGFNEIIFTSPSTVENFLNVYKSFPKDVQLTCIGPVTERCLKEQASNQ